MKVTIYIVATDITATPVICVTTSSAQAENAVLSHCREHSLDAADAAESVWTVRADDAIPTLLPLAVAYLRSSDQSDRDELVSAIEEQIACTQ